MSSSKRLIPAVAAAAAVLVDAPSAYALNGQGSGGRLHAAADSSRVRASGTLTFNKDGSFTYVPAAGFTGTDTFTYTVANAVHPYTSHVPSLGTVGGVALNGGAFGSALAKAPGAPNEYYGLEQRQRLRHRRGVEQRSAVHAAREGDDPRLLTARVFRRRPAARPDPGRAASGRPIRRASPLSPTCRAEPTATPS